MNQQIGHDAAQMLLAMRKDMGDMVSNVAESDSGLLLSAVCRADALPSVVAWLVERRKYRFATLVVQAMDSGDQLDYWFYKPDDGPWIKLSVRLAPNAREVPSVSELIHAIDWHERQAEDLFGLAFTGHPKLGDFVLHEEWPEGINPMRPEFDAFKPLVEKEVDPHWRPEKILHTPGAFIMPIGPVYSDYAESAQFFLETVGEDVVRMIPRFFFKYRGVEKLAEARGSGDVLLMVERFSGTSAVAHATAFCRAIESIARIAVPPRAEALRLIAAELERMRHHFGLLSDICHSTGMIVPSADIDIMEEEALRLSAQWAGHRYIYGLIIPGGVTRDFSESEMILLTTRIAGLAHDAQRLYERLQFTSSFLDRFEGVGVVPTINAQRLGLVGPIARASDFKTDLRIHAPYGFYHHCPLVAEALESEGDGYARIRLLFAEVFAAAELIQRAAVMLPVGAVVEPVNAVPAGDALGVVEAPKGAAFHYVRTSEDGQVARLQMTTPSFTNWHGFHLAAENFAFQDFPIMMASFGLSIAESDR
ncbi:MAG: NADH-quinone oxidoreductase subunit C [Planctomycetia bacterium]|nr:NADH-quinone oxidoreductase subunit C [Planctomycetia bacterium]